MKRILSVLVLLVSCGFTQQALGAAPVELPGDVWKNQCQAEEAAAVPEALEAVFTTSCSTSRDCPCPNLCICKPWLGQCFCPDTCCATGPCP